MTESKQVLVELGVEEIPARMMEDALGELEERAQKWQEDNRLPDGSLEVYGTPRRLVVSGELPANQETRKAKEKGPPVDVAYSDGDPTQALEGFCKQHDVDPSETTTETMDGGEYVVLETVSEGQPLEDALEQTFGDVFMAMDWPKSMRWDATGTEFIRPIRWVLAFCDDSALDLTVGPVESGTTTRGLRFTDNERININGVDHYWDQLEEETDIVLDQNRRRDLIREKAEQFASVRNGEPVYDEDLLDEVTHLVEAPTPFVGEFEERFLDVPDAVLIESMQSHQWYFPIEDDEGLLPCFIGVRNGGEEHLETVVEGNEKVLRARLNDAEFFYNKDLETDYESYRSKLDGVVFQEELGSLFDKTERVSDLVDQLYEGERKEELLKAARHCKNDLVTDMVEEFPKLQGTMGKVYARESGWETDAASLIEEHYKPKGRSDALPGQATVDDPDEPADERAIVLALTDRLDTLVGFFGLGKRATGSSDPFGLRRDALGVLRLLLADQLDRETFDLRRLIDLTTENYAQDGFDIDDPHREDLGEFFEDRLFNYFSSSYPHDLLSATVPLFWNRPLTVRDRLEWLDEWQGTGQFDDVLTAYERPSNILAGEDVTGEPDADLFRDDSEKILHEAVSNAMDKLDESLSSGNSEAVLSTLAGLRMPVDDFFESVMVMADDESLKKNRLRLLEKLKTLFERVADFSVFE
ncbi:MAG: glycine--tRNA ligase subunit beta [bacterium]